MFEKPVVKTFQYGNHTVTLETGVIARQATAAVIGYYGRYSSIRFCSW